MKSPAATLSGFLGLGVSVAMLLPKCTDGQGIGVVGYSQSQSASTQAPALSQIASGGSPGGLSKKSQSSQGEAQFRAPRTLHKDWLHKEKNQ